MFEQALDGNASWTYARQAHDVAAAKQLWFQYSLMPELGISIPPPPSTITGLRRALTFDPTETLLSVSTPTLAFYGALDRNVDAADSATHLREYLARAGARDVTIEMYPNAGHQLVVSKSGYNGDAELPERFVPGYPQITIEWLEQRGVRARVNPPQVSTSSAALFEPSGNSRERLR